MSESDKELQHFLKHLIPLLILGLTVIIGGQKLYQLYQEKNLPPVTIQSKLEPSESTINFPDSAVADRPAKVLPDRKTLSKDEIKIIEKELDQTNLSTTTTFAITSYDNIEDATNAYQDYLKSTSGKVLLYFGFDECPYCQAFSPKASWYAKDEGVTIYHVNTRDLPPIATNTLKEKYQLQTVPTMILFENGQVALKVDQSSSIKAIREIIQLAK